MTTSDTRRVALEERVAAIRVEISECVRELLVVDDLPRFAVAERLVDLGSAFDDSLERLRRDPDSDADVVAQVGLLAFMNGNREWATQVLLDEIENRGEWATLAAKRLADARVPGVGAVVLVALRETNPNEFDTIVGFLHALHVTGCILPQSDKRELLSNPHWQVASAVADWFPDSK